MKFPDDDITWVSVVDTPEWGLFSPRYRVLQWISLRGFPIERQSPLTTVGHADQACTEIPAHRRNGNEKVAVKGDDCASSGNGR